MLWLLWLFVVGPAVLNLWISLLTPAGNKLCHLLLVLISVFSSTVVAFGVSLLSSSSTLVEPEPEPNPEPDAPKLEWEYCGATASTLTRPV